MEYIDKTPECAYQYFYTDVLNRAEIFEIITLAHLYAENFGPVIMICTEPGYEFLITHMLDEFYIDIIICPDEQSAKAVVDNLRHKIGVEETQFINSLENCHENLRILYGEEHVNAGVLDIVRQAIEKEDIKNRI